MNEQLMYLASASLEAARHVDILPSGHRSREMHGHSFTVKVRSHLPAGWGGFPGAEVDELKRVLNEAIEPINYQLLNKHMDTPTDENLARWVRGKIKAPNVAVVGIQSTSDEGVDLDSQNNAHIWRSFRFEAAHQLPNVPDGHQCGRMHGHGFKVILHANQSLRTGDMGIDFDYLSAVWQPIHEELHYSCLNDIPGLENPTSEIQASWIWQRLKPTVSELSWVTVYETVSAGCHFDGEHYRIWKEDKFESALQLTNAPKGDHRRSLHGHSYMIRLHLTSPLDEVMGWTVDYGDVKQLFKPVYNQIDHHLLVSVKATSSTVEI